MHDVLIEKNGVYYTRKEAPTDTCKGCVFFTSSGCDRVASEGVACTEYSVLKCAGDPLLMDMKILNGEYDFIEVRSIGTAKYYRRKECTNVE
jgi:hypothetical protein